MSKIFVVNAGSSSLKFQLLNMPREEVITSGIFERIGLEEGIFTIKYNGKKEVKEMPIEDHSKAVKILLNAVVENKIVNSLNEIDACGHRVVHGGEYFNDSAIVSDDVVDKVESLKDLAPLHNPANLTGYYAFHKALPNVKHVFTFDTAFHQTIEEDCYLYPLPIDYYENYRVRKYGFHGTSHQYVSNEAINYLGNPKSSRIIVCHLGNGASVSAIKDGKSIDTSMGFTPLAGLMMGTRSGDIDPSVLPYIMEKENLDIHQMLDVLNKKSGMLGVSGVSSDSRDIEELYEKGDPRAIRTSKLYAKIVSKYIGSYVMELGGVDAIAFTAGLGENAAYLRELVINFIADALATSVDVDANNSCVRQDTIGVISTEDSKVKVLVIPTNEEIVIARDTARLLGI